MKQEFFQFTDGRRLSWFEAGSGPALVLLHGWSISAAAFSEIAGLLSSEYRLLIPDLPGHGESSPAKSDDLSGLAADLVEWLRHVAADDEVCLAGWSLGGMLSMHIAASQAFPLDKLLLIGTTPRFTNADDWSFGLPGTQVQVMKRNLLRRFEKTLGEFLTLTLAGEAIPVDRLRKIRNFAVLNQQLPDKKVAAALLDLLACQDQRELLPQIECPVLVLHGALDQISAIRAGKFLADALPHGTLVEFPGVGHAPFWSRPEEFAAYVREFC